MTGHSDTDTCGRMCGFLDRDQGVNHDVVAS